MKGTLAALLREHHTAGCVDWIGLRPARRVEMVPVSSVELGLDGFEGDHGRAGKRAVTLIQAEHLPVIAALCGGDVTPEALRRNILVSGINLNALRGEVVAIGEARIEIGPPCAPCSRMREALGPGGYNAMRGHGGWCAQVIAPGLVEVGTVVAPV